MSLRRRRVSGMWRSWYKRVVRCLLRWGPLVLVCGCSFDASGIAESSAAGPGTSGSTASSSSSGAAPGSSGGVVTTGEAESGSAGSSGGVGPVTTGGPGTSGPGTTDVATTTGLSESSTGGSESSTAGPDETTTTGAPTCPQSYKQIVKVADASVVAPMAKYMSEMGEGTIAYSQESEKGIVSFSIEPPCDGPVAVWARVQDAKPGVNDKDPDSFYPHVDDLPEEAWAYGCQTWELNAGYHWLRVRMGEIGASCDTFVDWSPPLTAGAHVVSLRNREGKSGTAVASIARLLVTADLNYVPGGGD